MNHSFRALYYSYERSNSLHGVEPEADFLRKHSNSTLLVRVNSRCNSYQYFRLLNCRLLADNSVYAHPNWWEIYVKKVAEILASLSSEALVTVAIGDNREDYPFPVIAKSRKRVSKNVSILSLNHVRHWGTLKNVEEQDTPWAYKLGIAYWRGATTGVWNSSLSSDQCSARCNLVKKLISGEIRLVDAAVSKIVQGAAHFFQNYDIDVASSDFIKGSISMHEHLKHKYILALEGNDVATNLKWILRSTSVPIMPIPSYESWCMEFLLKPWVHYIPVEHDMSDLELKINWCKQNDKLVQQIGINGQNYIKQFAREKRELKIAKQTVYLAM